MGGRDALPHPTAESASMPAAGCHTPPAPIAVENVWGVRLPPNPRPTANVLVPPRPPQGGALNVAPGRLPPARPPRCDRRHVGADNGSQRRRRVDHSNDIYLQAEARTARQRRRQGEVRARGSDVAAVDAVVTTPYRCRRRACARRWGQTRASPAPTGRRAGWRRKGRQWTPPSPPSSSSLPAVYSTSATGTVPGGAAAIATKPAPAAADAGGATADRASLTPRRTLTAAAAATGPARRTCCPLPPAVAVLSAVRCVGRGVEHPLDRQRRRIVGRGDEEKHHVCPRCRDDDRGWGRGGGARRPRGSWRGE